MVDDSANNKSACTSSNNSGAPAAEDVAVTRHGARSWHLLAGALTLEDQIRLFGFIQERDATDWEKLPPCMDPKPKTLELVQQPGGTQSARTLSYQQSNDDDETPVVVEMVTKAIDGILEWPRQESKTIKSLTMAVIRYCAKGSGHPCVGDCFPPHIDHCNDGSWVVLFSLGCTATFCIQTPDMAQRHTFDMNSGDVLVFDPSSEAAVVHGVVGVSCGEAEEASPSGDGLGAKFDVLRSSRFGVQCRVSFSEES